MKLVCIMGTKYFLIAVIFILFNIKGYSQLSPDYGLYGLWAKRAAFGSNGNAYISSSTVDEQGNVYLSGQFTGSLNFSDDMCNPSMSSVDPSVKGKGLFLMKVDKNGRYVWHVVYEISQGTPDFSASTNPDAIIYDYKDGKLLLYGRLVYQGIMSTLGVKATLYLSDGSTSSTGYTKPTNSVANDRFYFQFLHVIDVNTGSFESFLSPFISTTQHLTARFQGDQVHAIHMGWDASFYTNNSSLVSIYDADGIQVGTNKIYPGQPYASPGASGCGSTIVKHVTMPVDGKQVIVHNSYGKSGAFTEVPSYYLLVYDQTYDTKEKQFLLSDRAIEYFPHLSTDNSNHLYLAVNYGKSDYWNGSGHITNSNKLTNFLGTGRNFETEDSKNKVVLAKMKTDFSGVEWMFQLGGNTVNGHYIVATDMKTVGNYTYMTGFFMGQNVNFNGKILSNAGTPGSGLEWNFDGFYAVFDNNNGNCVYAVNIGDVGYEEAQTLSLSSGATRILIGGIYNSRIFQSDPSGRLYPLTSNGINNQGFVTLYSTDPASTPMAYQSSFGDAPSSYDDAVHHVYPCLRLGNLDLSKTQLSPGYSVDANTAQNDDAVNIVYTGGFVDLTSADFRLDASGNLSAKIKVYNETEDAAKVIGWIDFNRNGEFDGASEASSVATVAANTVSSSATVTITWSAANTRLRNGTTYMRLRMTTDNMDETQPAGLFFNGEVEDYRLDFNILEISKTAESNHKANDGTADVGDTITYSIKIKNNTAASISNISLFDPVPDSTVYVDNSARIGNTVVSTTQPQHVMINGQNVPSVVWPSFSLAAGAVSEEYSFKVTVKNKPADTDSIVNIAWAVANGDTINSSGLSCELAEIEVNTIRAVDDLLSILKNETRDVDVLNNDYYLPDCAPMMPVITQPPVNGTAALNGNKITYTPVIDFVGVDSIKYAIVCSGRTEEAVVYITVSEIPDNVDDINCRITPEATDWGIVESTTHNTDVLLSNVSQVLVGDLNGDGYPEIVSMQYAPPISGVSWQGLRDNGYADSLIVYIGPDHKDVVRIANPDPGNRNYYDYKGFQLWNGGGFALAKPTVNSNEAWIFAVHGNRKIYAFDSNGNQKWTGQPELTMLFDASADATRYKETLYDIGIADFNNDGISEIYCGPYIIDAQTGNIICTSPGNIGLSNSFNILPMYHRKKTSPIAADIDGDGTLEYIAGNEIYKVDISAGTMSLYKSIAPPANMVSVTDGKTQIADIDFDGFPDVIISDVDITNSTANIWIWSPAKNEILASRQIANVLHQSLPFIGDIDGDNRPELLFVTSRLGGGGTDPGRQIHSFKYQEKNTELQEFWTMSHSDPSGTTGITLFDFNQDSIAEIVYRDMNNLRIIDGSLKKQPYPYDLNTFPCFSSTGHEYPVIADVDDDGNAEILVIGHHSNYTGSGPLRIFKSLVSGDWAPARPVWNQYAYNAVNINNDLSVPRYQMNPATTFAGEDGVLGTADDIRPYNAFLQQQTLLDKDGLPYFLAPDVYPAHDISDAVVNGSAVTVTVGFVNHGSAAIGPPVCAALYKETISGGSLLMKDSISTALLPGDTAYITFHIPDITTYLPFVNFVVRINDKGEGFPIQQECVVDNNVLYVLNPALHLLMKKDATLLGEPGNGTYPNPVSVLYGETIEYKITAVNANTGAGRVIISDTLPAYLKYETGTATDGGVYSTYGASPVQDVLTWTFPSMTSLETKTVNYEAKPEEGVCASQPMFINRAWIKASDTLLIPTNMTYHQGAGVGLVTFSAGAGGRIYHADPQVLDYQTSPRQTAVVSPDKGYQFTGWSHDDYVSLRAETIKAQEGIMHYDTLVIYGNVELRANFEPEIYKVHYYLNGASDVKANPSTYTVESDTIFLKTPEKEGDTFIGWTGSNGEKPEMNVAIQKGTTGELEFYANFLYSGREGVHDKAEDEGDKVWASKNKLYVKTSKIGAIVKIYSLEGILCEQHTILSDGISSYKLPPDMYVVTLNNGIGYKIVIE